MIVVFTVYMVGVALLTLAERKISAWIQGRHGPNRVGGKLGLLQPAADGVKNIMKEETLPAHVNKPMFMLAPMLAFIPAMLTWAVIPFGAPWDSRWGRIEMVVADLPVGFLFTLAITSLGVYGIVLAGWASNNKYALLGGPALERADDLLRDRDGHVAHSGAAARRQRLAEPDRGPAGEHAHLERRSR